MSKDIVCFVPARGGSKGIPKKNIYLLNNQPLLAYTMKAADQVSEINAIYLSSDDSQILDCGTKYSEKVICLMRPSSLSGDTTTTDEVLSHFIKNGLNKQFLSKKSIICLTQPTSPLRSSQQISEALQLYEKSSVSLVVSVTQKDSSILKSYVQDKNGLLTPIRDKNDAFTPRQLLPKVVSPNGALYIFSVESFLTNNCMPRNNLRGYEMSQESSIDIDSIEDVKQAERTLKRRL